MPATMTFDNLIIHSMDSKSLVILAHGSFEANAQGTTVPFGSTLIWHSVHNDFSIIPHGKRFITGTQSFESFIHGIAGETQGGQVCRNYTLSCTLADNMLVKGKPLMDYVTIKPGRSAPLSDVWDAMESRNLEYSYVHYWACRVEV